MKDTIFYTVGDSFRFIGDEKKSISSTYLDDYKRKSNEITQKREWKHIGSGAEFRNDQRTPSSYFNDSTDNGRINGVTLLTHSNRLLYTASIENASALMIKDLKDCFCADSYLIHGTEHQFYNLDYNKNLDKLLVSIGNNSLNKHIALLDMDSRDFHLLTEGDTIDDNPHCSRLNPSHVYFDSCGIGRNDSGNILGYSEKVINRMDLEENSLSEVVSFNGFDCYSPKTDMDNNLYFLKKPFNESYEKTSPLDILLIPFKILKGVYYFLNFFTMRYTGESFTEKGPNPAKSKPQDMKRVYINNNLINAEKTMKENKSKGEKFPGIAPNSWELMMKNSSDEIISLKKGVLDFEITGNNEIICSDGAHIIKLARDGSQTLLHKINLAQNINSF